MASAGTISYALDAWRIPATIKNRIVDSAPIPRINAAGLQTLHYFSNGFSCRPGHHIAADLQCFTTEAPQKPASQPAPRRSQNDGKRRALGPVPADARKYSKLVPDSINKAATLRCAIKLELFDAGTTLVGRDRLRATGQGF